jgi:hypothetical protein
LSACIHTCHWPDNNSEGNLQEKLTEDGVEYWTVEYIVDRLFFEMLELKMMPKVERTINTKDREKDTMIEHMTLSK